VLAQELQDRLLDLVHFGRFMMQGLSVAIMNSWALRLSRSPV